MLFLIQKLKFEWVIRRMMSRTYQRRSNLEIIAEILKVLYLKNL